MLLLKDDNFFLKKNMLSLKKRVIFSLIREQYYILNKLQQSF